MSGYISAVSLTLTTQCVTRRKGTQLALLTLATLYPGMSGCKVSNSILITRETGKISMIHHNRTKSWQQELGQEFLVELPRRLHV